MQRNLYLWPRRATWQVRLPVEVLVALAFGSLWLVGIAVGLPINLPNPSDAAFLEAHFFGPLALASLLQLVLTILMRYISKRSHPHQDPFLMLKMFPLIALAVFLYFNFKAWMPLVHPRLYDPQLQHIDLVLSPVLTLVMTLRQGIAALAPFSLDNLYGVLYFAMFFVSLGVHGLIDTQQHQRQLVLGMCLNLFLGGIAYWIAPAAGPLVYRDGANVGAQPVQHAMLAMFEQVRATGTLPPGYFSAPLGAMPSLHVAHSVFFSLCAARSARGLLIPYLPIVFWIFIEASASGWHYLIDLPAGVLLALISFTLARRWISAAGSSDVPPARNKHGGGLKKIA